MAKHPGTTITVVDFPFGSVKGQELTCLQSGNCPYDILNWTPSMLGDLAPFMLNLTSKVKQTGFDLNKEVPSSQNFNGYNSFLNSTTKKVQTDLVGLAVATDVELVYYRTDLFQKYSLPTPTTTWTWDQFNNDAKVLCQGSAGVTSQSKNCPTGYPTVIDLDTSHDLWNTYINYMAYFYNNNLGILNTTKTPSYGPQVAGYGTLFSSKLSPSFDPALGTAGIQAALSLQTSLKYSSDDPFGMTFGKLATFFGTGQYGMTIAWTTFYKNWNNASKSQAAGNFAIAPLPGNTGQPGGSGMGISKQTKNAALAWDFLQFVASDDEQPKMFTTSSALFPGTVPGFNKLIASDSSLAWVQNVLNAAVQANANPSTIANTWLLIPTLNNSLQPYLLNGTPQELTNALASAAKSWVQLLKVAATR
jgi:ABC-type glycerol-3-phosphate transport system substrate-binding protein